MKFRAVSNRFHGFFHDNKSVRYQCLDLNQSVIYQVRPVALPDPEEGQAAGRTVKAGLAAEYTVNR